MDVLSIPCPRLIGRAAAVDNLRRLVDRARTGQRAIGLISGTAGIGKSRLVAEVQAYARSLGMRSATTACFAADRTSPLTPILDGLRLLLDQAPESQSSPLVAQAGRAFWPWFPHLAPEHAASEVSAPVDKGQAFQLLTRLLLDLAARQPILLVIEDVHWIDETSLELLSYLARRSAGGTLCILLTYRDDEAPPVLQEFLGQMDRARLAEEVHLSPLSRDEVQAMLQAILGLAGSGLPDLFYAVYPLSEGNPFFVEELVKSLVTSADLRVEDGRWVCGPMATLHVPRSVRTAVQQRTALLDERAHQVLRLAATAGRRFDFNLLLDVTGLPEPALLAAIKELIAAQLVIEESADRFAFRHALIRQAVEAQLLARERQALHRAIAAAMERRYASSPGIRLADLAYHSYEAGAWAEALAYNRQAGEQALRLYAPRAAVEHLSRALRAADAAPLPAPAAVYALRGQAQQMMGKFEGARRDFETALTRAQAAGESQAAWQALVDLGSLWAERDYARSGVYYQQALDLARSLEQPRLLAQSLNRLGNWHLNVEQPGLAMDCHRQALALFEGLGDERGLAETCDLLGIAAYLRGDLRQGLASFRQAEAFFRRLDDRVGLASCLANQVTASGGFAVETVLARPPLPAAEALERGEEALRLARDMEQSSAEAYALLRLAGCLGRHGEYGRALTLAHQGLQVAASIQHRQWMTDGHFTLGLLFLDILAAEEARQHLEQGLALAREIGSLFWIRVISGLLARAHLLLNEPAGAETILRAAGPQDRPPQTFGLQMLAGAQIELACARGQVEPALRGVEALTRAAQAVGAETVPPALLLLQGRVWALAGRAAEAEDALQAALALAEAQDLRPMLWRIHLELGRLWLPRRRDAALVALDRAQAIGQEVAAQWPDADLRDRFLAALVARLPAGATLTARQAAKLRAGGLTDRERAVAMLIARGKSNAEIAEELVVGKRTVESHITSILSKLGMRSRTEIALWVRDRQLLG